MALSLKSMANQLRHCKHLETVRAAKLDEVWHSRHGTVVLHDIADDASRLQAGHQGQVHRGFCLTCSHKDTTLSCPKWEYMSRARKVLGGRARIDGDTNRMGAIMRRDSCRHPLFCLDAFGKRSAKARSIRLGHRTETEIIGTIFG